MATLPESRAVKRVVSEAIPNATMTPDEFLAWSGTVGNDYDGYKVELSNGRVTKMMTNVTRGHAEVVTNLFRILVVALNSDDYLVSCSKFGIKLKRSVRFPDLMVEPQNSDKKAGASDNPIFITEVLSPSTTAVDFPEKLPEYTTIPTLKTYLICSQDEPIVWLMARADDGGWPSLPEKIQGVTGVISVPAFGLNLAMADIYRGIPSPPEVWAWYIASSMARYITDRWLTFLKEMKQGGVLVLVPSLGLDIVTPGYSLKLPDSARI